MNKKAQGMSLNVIIIAALALIVLLEYQTFNSIDKVKEKLGSVTTGAIDYVKDMLGKGKKTLDDLVALPSQPSAALTEGEKLAYKAIIKEAKKRKKQILIEQNSKTYEKILKAILKFTK